MTIVNFDDQSRAVRHLVVDTGGWLVGQRVLIAPVAAGECDDERRVLPVALTRRQVESGGIRSH